MVVAKGYFQRCIHRSLVLAWDRIAAHRAKPVQAFRVAQREAIGQERLPPQGPDLNPCEQRNDLLQREMDKALPPSAIAMRV